MTQYEYTYDENGEPTLKLYGGVSVMGQPDYDDIMKSDLPREEKVKQIKLRGQAYRDKLDDQLHKDYARIGLGGLVSAIGALPIAITKNPVIGSAIGGGVYELGQGIMEGDELPELMQRAGWGGAIGGAVGGAVSKLPDAARFVNNLSGGRIGEGVNSLANRLASNRKVLDATRGLNNFLNTDINKLYNPFKYNEGILFDQDSFHGTPFSGDIKKFDLDFMNTGEGAQMYGAGIYTAKDRNVANRHYRFLGEDIEPIKYKGQPLMSLYYNLEKQALRLHPRDAQPIYDKMSLLEDLDYKGGLDNLEYYSPEVQNWFKNEIEPNLTMPGRLYRVQVPDNDVLLHSELPLNEQPEKVQKALRDMFFDQGIDIDNPKNIYDNQKPYSEVSGQTLYNIMNGLIDGNATNRKATSKLFDEYGIKGIRAFGDRDGEIFVTFNPNNAKIMESYYPNKVYNTQILKNPNQLYE